MTLGDYIKNYRHTHKYSMDEFALRTGISKAYISILERNYNPSTGKAAIPSLDTIKRVAVATNADFNDLIAMLDDNQAVLVGSGVIGKIQPNNITPIPEMHRIPILGRISAGLPLYAEENIEGYTHTDLNGGAEYFALRVQGDSMTAARIQDGDTLIVRRQEVVENGQIAVVMVGDEEATVKRFYQSGTGITLMPQSTNPAHQPQLYDTRNHNIRVIGLVVKNEISF